MSTATLEINSSLANALDCDNEEDILDGFMDRYNVTRSEAKEIFHETKKWLWLASESYDEKGSGLFIDTPLMIIDEMWHNFILYTKSYHSYCMDKFKKFIHHTPTPNSIKREHRLELEIDPINAIEKQKGKTREQLSFIYDKLGAETVMKWYEELPGKYTPDVIVSLKK